jgi:hypothetical protein
MKTDYVWNGNSVYYCGLCEAFGYQCKDCGNGSCTGGGCDKCCGSAPPNNYSIVWSEQYNEITKGWIIPTPSVHIAFISGHLDLTAEEFDEHYASRIFVAECQGHKFVVGDARGTDSFAHQMIDDKSLLSIYHMFDMPRNSVRGAKLIGGFKSDEGRDTVMTKESTYDIAWVRPGREKSGTQNNLNRRLKLNKQNKTL